MRLLKLGSLLAIVGLLLFAGSPSSRAQVAVQIGPAPVCPYGYYAVPPYQCAPYGYYGPEWFSGGIFIGAGPWFHGPENFHGRINNRYDIHRGYHGARPHRGEQPDWNSHRNFQKSFRGNEERDGHGHTVSHGNRGHDDRH
ncbi:MAG TPA: hypothetical protein VGT04_01665 [Acidobacteriaceae bacterium]|nr:hypothetical protein [Acidobacteriaceae bacterium]